jgi:putative ABC transport system permease protein
MFKNYVKTAIRSLLKNKFYSALNIVGLSVGMAFMLLIAVYAWQELNVNRALKNLDNQYILLNQWKDPNMGFELGTIAELPAALKRSYPNLVKSYLRWDGIISTISKGDKHFRQGIQIVDSTMLQTYGFKLLHGDSNTALKDPFSAVITTDAAIKYFGNTDVVGQTINIENFSRVRHDFIVSGVLADIPKNSVTYINDDNKNEIFINAEAAAFMGRSMSGWNNPGLVAYLELQDGVTPSDLEQPIQQLINANAPTYISQNLKVNIVGLSQYHLTANGGVVNKMLYTLGATTLFILCMAIINFINLCISRSSARMKEMGVRKVLGSLRKQLIAQFLVESTLLTLLAALLSLGLYLIFSPYFSVALATDMLSLLHFPLWFFWALLTVALVIGIVAGIYPAFVLSSLKSVDSLKGKLTTIGENVLLRKVLVGFQFGTAAVVFICALIIAQQVKLFFSKDLGYRKDFVVYVQTPRDISAKGVRKMEAIKEELEQLPQVSSATLSWEVPNGRSGGPVQLQQLRRND